MTVPAYIYARYSSAEQSRGHSLTRQLEDGEAYVRRQGWLFDADRALIDKGRSAFSGRNRKPGTALYDFEQKAAQGHFSNGVVLAVENIDRLTRQGWRAALDLITDLTGKGVTVAIWQSPQRIFQAYQQIEMIHVVELVLLSEGARKAQADKGDRVAQAWVNKTTSAAEGARAALTRIVPGWIDVHPETRAMTLNPHRADLLNSIFDWYVDGRGIPFIVRELNGRGELNWGRGKHGGKPWDVGTIHKYLTSRTVLGEYAPKVRLPEDQGRVSRGFVIPDYYPQAITADKFNNAQVARGSRMKWRTKKVDSFPNLFQGIATCGECGGRMAIASYRRAGQVLRQKADHSKGAKGPVVWKSYTVKQTRGYLRCSNAAKNAGCSHKDLHHYQPLEAGVLRYLWDFITKGQFIKPNSDAGRLTTAVAEQERQIELKGQALATVLTNLESVASPALAQRAKDIQDDIAGETTKLEALRLDLSKETAKATPTEDLEALMVARSALERGDTEDSYPARTKAHQSLRRLVNIMECQSNGETMIVFGNYGAGITFNRDGKCTDLSALAGARYEGPDGEPNWHPDAEAAE